MAISQAGSSLPRLLASPSFGGMVVGDIHWALLPCLSRPRVGDRLKSRIRSAASPSAQEMNNFRIIERD